MLSTLLSGAKSYLKVISDVNTICIFMVKNFLISNKQVIEEVW